MTWEKFKEKVQDQEEKLEGEKTLVFWSSGDQAGQARKRKQVRKKKPKDELPKSEEYFEQRESVMSTASKVRAEGIRDLCGNCYGVMRGRQSGGGDQWEATKLWCRYKSRRRRRGGA